MGDDFEDVGADVEAEVITKCVVENRRNCDRKRKGEAGSSFHGAVNRIPVRTLESSTHTHTREILRRLYP